MILLNMVKIPLLSTPDKALSSSTQELLLFADIVDNLVIHKNGGASLVLESTSLNFGLLSVREQQAVIAAYAGLLNSLNYPIQILVRSQKKDISNYMKTLDRAEKEIKSPKLAAIMKGYKNFILEAVKKKNVLSKSFFIIIPFTPFELGVAKSMKSTLAPKAKNKPLGFPKTYVLRKAKITLLPKRDHLMRQMGRLGIQLKQLNNDELVELTYNTYNPQKPIKEKNIFQ